MTTSDRNDPRLTRGVDTEPVDQAEVYLVLSEEERAMGFVRPVRRTYVHVGSGTYPRSTAPCGGVATSIGLAIAKTYARDPKFYGGTYCLGCRKHLPVGEFRWDDGQVVGS